MYDLNSYLVAQRADLVAVYTSDYEFSEDLQGEIPDNVGFTDVVISVAGVAMILAVILGGAFFLIAP